MTPNNRTAGQVFGSLGKALCYLLLFLLTQSLVSIGYTLTAQLYATLNPGSGLNPTELVTSCIDQISLISGAAALIILAAFFLLRRKNPLKECGFLRTRGRLVFLGVGLAPVLYLAIISVLGLLPEHWMEDYLEASSVLSETGILMVLSSVVMAPLVEEVIFRGLVLTRLHRGIPGWLAVLITALLFSVCHAQVVWMAYAFVLGVLFGFLSLGARSIWPSLAAHLVFNGIGQFVVFLEERAVDSQFPLLMLAGLGALICIATLIFSLTHPLRSVSDT